jgi:hypothetical protein
MHHTAPGENMNKKRTRALSGDKIWQFVNNLGDTGSSLLKALNSRLERGMKKTC